MSELVTGGINFGNNNQLDFIVQRYQNTPEQPQEPDNVKRHRQICERLNSLYAAKNADYGDAFHMGFQKRGITMALIRLEDKLSRLDRLTSGEEQKVKDESIRDTLMDLANYTIMTLIELEEK